MLRMLGFIAIVVVCLEMAPWGVLVGVIMLVGWLFLEPAPQSKTYGLHSRGQKLTVTDAGNSFLSAIPLQNAVYCANCDLITNSTHDACGVCGSHSVIGVSRIWKLTLAEATTNEGRCNRYKVSFTIDIREIPASGLNESTKLISRLAELGGDVKTIHISVDPVFSGDTTPSNGKIDVLSLNRLFPRQPAS